MAKNSLWTFSSLICSQHFSQWRKSLVTGGPSLCLTVPPEKLGLPPPPSPHWGAFTGLQQGAASQSGSEDCKQNHWERRRRRRSSKPNSSSTMDVNLLVLLCVLAIMTQVPSPTGEFPHFFAFFPLSFRDTRLLERCWEDGWCCGVKELSFFWVSSSPLVLGAFLKLVLPLNDFKLFCCNFKLWRLIKYHLPPPHKRWQCYLRHLGDLLVAWPKLVLVPSCIIKCVCVCVCPICFAQITFKLERNNWPL